MVILLVLGCARGGDETVPLADEERQQVTELVLSVAEDPEETLKPAHDELWSILRRHGSPSRKLLNRLKTELLIIGEGHHLFWLDAREALKTHRVVKSRSRAEWEERLAKNGWLSPQQRDRFDGLMKQVANEEPIEANHGVEVSLSPALVDEIANSWDERGFEQAIAILLTPPK